MDIHFANDNYYDIERRDGLFCISLRIIHSKNSSAGEKVKFILDTGAYLTVLSRGTAIQFGFDKLQKVTTTLYGFGGGIDVDFVRIPGLIILGKLRTNVPVLIPHDMYRIHEKTGEKKVLPDVLGLNVLEYYNYYINAEHDKLYLKENPNPRFYSNELASGEAF